ncbi:MAG: histidine kinase [uncultured bacterium]|uniref:Two component transcriptional regulator, winged helix family n=1 Tax=Candidatus Wolfebacteria bacterium GW2011_GWE2_44_13 TaxID=1619017 RepID=A0A0G1H919_9BACT|nr:MAG: histidine kinase [uncultured bacterium]KKT43871.1 MAG: Two component transcriptional regulator, winged helix family [Candidatus Wolfebacteria bacterium GW2011_GWE2_44_13]
MEQQPEKTIKILIAEDEGAMRNAIADKVRREGFAEPLLAKNGEEGLALALQEHPDLLLVDILMPKMDGITMVKELRKDAWGETAKVIILTNFDTTDAMLKDIVLVQPSYYLLKSNWKIDDIIIKLKEVLKAI